LEAELRASPFSIRYPRNRGGLTATILLKGLLAAAVICAAHEPARAADKIRISVTNFNMAFLPAGLAVKRGFFKEEGLGGGSHPHER